MDGKNLAIILLSLLLIVGGVVGVALWKDAKNPGGPAGGVGDIMAQEKAYQNENERSLLDRNDESYFRSENAHLYQDAKFLANRGFRKALLLFDTGQYKEALAVFTELKVDSLDAELSSAAYYYIASCLVNMNEEKRALGFLDRIVQRLKPNQWTTRAIILQGEINRKYQFSNESLEVYLHKLHIETPDPAQREEILVQLGYLKLFRNDLEGAMTHFQRAETPLARLGQARVFIRKDMYWKAISIYEDMLEHRSFRNEAYYNDVKTAFLKQTYYYARRWMERGDYDHAYFYFRKIVNFFPNTMYGENSLFWIGEIFFSRGDFNTAIRYYNLVLSNGNRNKDPDALFKKAHALYNQKKFGEAMRNFQLVLDTHRDSAYAERARSWITTISRELQYRN